MYAFPPPYCTFSSSWSFSLHHHMARCCVRLEGHGARGATAWHEIQLECAVWQWSMERSISAMELDSVRSYRSNDTERSKTMSADFSWALLIMELFKRGEEWFAKIVAEPLHCEYLIIDAIQNMLRSGTACSELVRESSSQMLGN